MGGWAADKTGPGSLTAPRRHRLDPLDGTAERALPNRG